MTTEPVSERKVGSKHDTAKVPLFQVMSDFPDAILEVARVGQYGADKYGWHDWRKVEDASIRYRNAMARHLLDSTRQVFDRDAAEQDGVGLYNLAMVAWNALAVLQMAIEGDRAHPMIFAETYNYPIDPERVDTAPQP